MGSYIKLPAVGSNSNSYYHSSKCWDHFGKNSISQIFVSYDSDRVLGLQFLYEPDKTGCYKSPTLSELLGTMTSPKSCFHAVQMEYPQEYLTSVSIYEHFGMYGSNGGFGISFKTNMGKLHGPFSPGTDKVPITYYLGNNNQFGGFHGTRDESSIKSIGVYLQPKSVKKQPEESHAA